jgi:hypothetical protein
MTSTPTPCFAAQDSSPGEAQHWQRCRALIAAYRGCGGSVHANALASRLRASVKDGALQMTRGLMSGELVSFRIGACWHVPLFQFSRVGPGLRPDVSRVVQELRGRRDELEVAEWFVRPNPWLESRWPVVLLDRDYDAMLRAARLTTPAESAWATQQEPSSPWPTTPPVNC